MSLSIKVARSSVPDKQPQPTDLDFGEFGLNFSSAGPFLTVKDSDGEIRRLDRFTVSPVAPSNPTEGQAWLDTSGAQPTLKVLASGSWVSTAGFNPPQAATTAAIGLVRLADAGAVTAGTPGRVVDASQLLAVSSQITQADWLAPDGDPAEILNKPTIPPEYALPTATPTVLGGVLTASSTDANNGTAGKVVDAAQLKAVKDIAEAALPTAGGTVTGNLEVEGALTADLTGNVVGDVAGNVTGNLAGNADSADRLSTPREINGISFDGSADITLTATGPTPEAIAPGAFLSGSAFDGSAPVTWNVVAATAATADSLAQRDASGNLSANTFVGDLDGNAATASEAAVLSTPRNINGVPFDGSANIQIGLTATELENSITPGAYIDGAAFDGSSPQTWDVIAATVATPQTLAARDSAGALTATEFIGDLNGTADVALSANGLTTPRSINGIPFDGTANIVIPSQPGGQAELTAGLFLTSTGVYTGSAPVRFDVQASVSPTPDTLPARDGNGDVRAVTFIGALQGNADTATTATSATSASTATSADAATALANGRTLWGQNFDGTADVTGDLTGVGTITPTGGAALTLPTTGGTLATVEASSLPERGDVGAYAMLSNDGLSISSNATVTSSGTNLFYSEIQGDGGADPALTPAVTGTWRNMGPEISPGSTGLFLRIS